jgi:regulator of protease activity HflC (stomatin/prohibitin superfamily)
MALETTLLIFAAVLIVLPAGAIRIAREYRRVVAFLLGLPRGARGPGLVLVIPLDIRDAV